MAISKEKGKESRDCNGTVRKLRDFKYKSEEKLEISRKCENRDFKRKVVRIYRKQKQRAEKVEVSKANVKRN